MKAVIQRLANDVMHSLGKGHREAVYGRALSTALNHEGIVHRTQVNCPIQYQGECVGFGIADLIVDDYILELKVLTRIPTAASDQVKKYIESLYYTERKKYIGIVINWNSSSGKVDIVMDAAPLHARTPTKREAPSPPKRSRSPPHRRSPSPTTPIHKRVTVSRYFGMGTRSAAGSRASSRSPSPTGSVLWGRCSTRSKSVF